MGSCKYLCVRKLQNSIFKYVYSVLQIIGFQYIARPHLFGKAGPTGEYVMKEQQGTPSCFMNWLCHPGDAYNMRWTSVLAERTTGPLGKGDDKESWGGKCDEGAGKEVIKSSNDE